MKLPFALLFFLLALQSGCLGPGSTPHAFMPPVAEEYHRCDTCGSLHGGLYGKGPLESFPAAGAANCRHRWRLVSRTEFQTFAARHFPAEWANAGWFVKRPSDPTRLPMQPAERALLP